ncbi:MAG: cytochrome-c peroxidase [Methylococcaceae bacterium]|nr:cytochrome-c peroxidase [Methylococcaceae bacterium]
MFARLVPSSLIALGLLASTIAPMSVLAGGFGPLPISLKNVPIPEVPGLLDGPDPIVIDKEKAIALGKALFWDTNVGSDGMACASCHFHAGADSRTKNQLAPGGKSTPVAEQHFDLTASGDLGGANYALKKADFPFFQLTDPYYNDFNAASAIFQTDDVLSSAGTFSGKFSSVSQSGSGNDQCARAADPVYHVGAIGTRKVQSRNAPTVINAVFNFRNFWDGRANNTFNGSTIWGDRDPQAGVWVKVNARVAEKQKLHLQNAALASQAVGPGLNELEMSCQQRGWPDVGRKLLLRPPLQNQKVHHDDSVFSPLSLTTSTPGNLRNGLNTTYKNLIVQAFNPKYWSYTRIGQFGGPVGQTPYNQMEANFAMFFGLAVQMYEATLVSDDSPFDRSARDAQGLPVDLTASELNGLDLFRNAHCVMCHIGPAFTSAAVATNAQLVKTHPEAFGNQSFVIRTSGNVVSRFGSNSGTTLSDVGFTSTGVTPLDADIGLGGIDDFGHPLAFSVQYLQYLAGNNMGVFDAPVSAIRPCDFQLPFAINIPNPSTTVFTQADGVVSQAQSTAGCAVPAYGYQPTPGAVAAELAKPASSKVRAVMDGAFKIPSLRNIELTGPYMHNGSMASLEQVVEFYARGGNFKTPGKNFAFMFPLSLADYPETRADLIAFLKTLTDERVRHEQAPFDHPEIKIPNGHNGDNLLVVGGNPLSGQLARDEFLTIEAVGANGKASPVLPFENYLE